jgi:hypothetical protein
MQRHALAIGLDERRPQQHAEPRQHRVRASRVGVDLLGDHVQRVEQKVRPQLSLERR